MLVMMEANESLAYVAGFFDGEGSVSMKVNGSSKYGVYYSLCVTVANTNRDVIDFIHSIFGGGIYQVNPNSSPRHKHTLYSIGWYSTDAMCFLQSIVHLLIVKKDIAELGIMYWNDCVSGKDKNARNSPKLNSLRANYKTEMDGLQINNKRRVYV